MVLETDPWLTETRCVAAQAALHSAQVLPYMYDLSCLPVTSAEAGVLAAWQGARTSLAPSCLFSWCRGACEIMMAGRFAVCCWVQGFL